MQPRPQLGTAEGDDVTEGGTCLEETFPMDGDFAKATLEERAAFAEGQETILLEELRPEIA